MSTNKLSIITRFLLYIAKITKQNSLQELFIHSLAKDAFKQNQTQNTTSNTLDYKQLAEVVQMNGKMEFLQEIMPKKITVRQFRELMAKKNAAANSSDSESDSQSDSASESESEDDDDEDADSNEHSSDSEDENDNKENGKVESSANSGSSSSSDSDN